MYLKEIKAYGFKSFADKIEIEFSNNINGVVGPNGSGKSNIVDAVRWVLGEQSIKSLRGENTTDIIFSGSKNRKALNSAFVTLIFDNSDRHLPIDYNEVSVKRVAFRSGESEYYLNNERCRLKDIMELFTDSGAAKESFNIISQGKIDEILSTKATDRRTIFEEAAGVLKYKKRKEEAIRKLERTNDNINRINDIISELEVNLNPLKEQSDKAKLYNDTKSKLSEIEISLITSDIEKFNYEYKETEIKIEKLNDEISSLASERSNNNIIILKNKNRLKEIEDSLYKKQNLLLEYTKEMKQTDADIRILEERSKYKKNDKVNIDIDKIKNEIFVLKSQINGIDNELEVNKKKEEEYNNKLNEYISKYNENKMDKNNRENELNKNNRLINEYKYKINRLDEDINNNSILPYPVKNILNNPKFNGIHNTIGNLVDTEDKYSCAISTALSSSASYLVVDTANIAKKLVNYLKENNIGRATFYPLDVIKGRYVDSDTITKIKNELGFIDIASNLVTYDNLYKEIIERELGNVLVVDSIDTANNISNIIKNRYKIITLDGQVVNVGGSITGGNKIKSKNIISLKYELDDNKRLLDKLINENKELEEHINTLITKINETEALSNKIRLLLNQCQNENRFIKEEKQKYIDKLEYLYKELKDLETIEGSNEDSEKTKMQTLYYEMKDKISEIQKDIDILKLEKNKLEDAINDEADMERKSNNIISKKEKELNNYQILINRIDVKLDNLLLNLNNEYNLTFESAKSNYKLEMDEDKARTLVNNYKDTIKNIGLVNLGSIAEYERVSTRYEFLKNQKEDLLKAEDTLFQIISEMDEIMKEKFLETFNNIKKEFKIIFKELFKGGDADITLTDPDNVLETGIEIFAEPPGKKLQSISLLSGGEKTFTAISLLFAILNVRPVPFCILDEVEAALDDANVNSFGNYLNKYRGKTQFILITHKKKTMEFVDVLYGITMQEAGISKLVSVKLEDIKRS